MPGQLTVEDGLAQRAQQERVVRRQQVDGPPHRHDAHEPAVLEGPADDGGVEVAQPRPQPEVRVERDLGLHADEVVDGVERRPVRALEQQLAGHRGPVEGPRPEGRHGPIMARRAAGTRVLRAS